MQCTIDMMSKVNILEPISTFTYRLPFSLTLDLSSYSTLLNRSAFAMDVVDRLPVSKDARVAASSVVESAFTPAISFAV